MYLRASISSSVVACLFVDRSPGPVHGEHKETIEADHANADFSIASTQEFSDESQSDSETIEGLTYIEVCDLEDRTHTCV